MIKRLLYFLRNLVYYQIIEAIKKYSRGNILDVGGGEFYKTFLNLNIPFDSYTIVDKRLVKLSKCYQKNISFVESDAERMSFKDSSFDTIFCIHMLEHTLRPLDVISEIYRVLRDDGIVIFLVPQTSVPHDIPEHFYNFTRYFMEKALKNYGFKIIEIQMLGGGFQTIASHTFHLLLFILNHPQYREKSIKRDFAFFLSLPLKFLLLPILLIIATILAFGDIKEIANNILIVAKK